MRRAHAAPGGAATTSDLTSVAPAVQAAYWLVLGLLSIFGLHRLSLVLLFLRCRRAGRAVIPAPGDWPAVTVQLPIYNEPAVAERVIDAACRLDYPGERLEVQVLDDSDDRTVAIVDATAARWRARGRNVQVVRRGERVGYKAGALEAGLRHASGELIAVFDADFVPPPQFLRETVGHFADALVGAVQARWEHLNRNDSWLTRAQAALLDGHFVVEHAARNGTGRFMSFNGTAGIWRRTAIESSGGWQHDTLTEDLDLSYRAQLGGWRFVYLPAVTAPAELPPRMQAFKSQQRRWTQGGAQTCVKLLRAVLTAPLPWRVRLEAVLHLTSFLVYPLMVLLTLLVGPAIWLRARDPVGPGLDSLVVDALLFTVATGSTLLFYVTSQRALGRRWRAIAGELPLLMALGIGIAANNACAAVRGLATRAGEFVRTPKFGAGRAPRAAARRVHWVEAGLAAYIGVFVVAVLWSPHWVERALAALPFLGLFLVGYLYVALHEWLPARTPETLRPTASPAAGPS